ncbi:MAG: TetR family transcriptional regulator [Gramella sp.]|nr:TetR family transcriptional regulator [Christiangramia sp.]|tara:strand:+ start:338 stop:937 length:600 start_codon:yes stop_codon:yes gene_type:complete
MKRDVKMLEEISALFIKSGAKTVTMDDIAREFGISKKTLYQKYKNKEVLLEEVLMHSIEKLLLKMKGLDNKIDNAVERMFARDQEIENMSETNDSIMIRQLTKYYPQIFNKHMLYFTESFSEILIDNIKRGRKQKLYRENFDEVMYAKLFAQLVMTYHTSPVLDRKEITRDNYHQQSLDFYMNAITTDKGKAIMENLAS